MHVYRARKHRREVNYLGRPSPKISSIRRRSVDGSVARDTAESRYKKLKSDISINGIPRRRRDERSQLREPQRDTISRRVRTLLGGGALIPSDRSMADTRREERPPERAPRTPAFTRCRDRSRSSAAEWPAGPHTNHTKNGFVCASCLDSFAFAHCCTASKHAPLRSQSTGRPVDREKPR